METAQPPRVYPHNIDRITDQQHLRTLAPVTRHVLREAVALASAQREGRVYAPILIFFDGSVVGRLLHITRVVTFRMTLSGAR